MGSFAQTLLSVDLNLPTKGVVTRSVGRVAVEVGRLAKALVGMTWTLGRVARSDRMVLGILDAIVCVCSVRGDCYRRLTRPARLGWGMVYDVAFIVDKGVEIWEMSVLDFFRYSDYRQHLYLTIIPAIAITTPFIKAEGHTE
jgi:hypothetical protein